MTSQVHDSRSRALDGSGLRFAQTILLRIRHPSAIKASPSRSGPSNRLFGAAPSRRWLECVSPRLSQTEPEGLSTRRTSLMTARRLTTHSSTFASSPICFGRR
jgi:hypothetical protein